MTVSNAAKVRAVKAALKKPSPITISDPVLEELIDVFKLLADKSRLKILMALAKDGEMHVSALCAMLDQSQPAVSHHLTLMRAHRLVGYRRDGKHNFYRLECGRLCEILEQVFAENCNGHRQVRFADIALTYKRDGK